MDLHLPESLGWCGIHCLLILAIATTYSIWELFFHPIPTAVNWVFVFVAFAIHVNYRQSVRMRHTWEPKPAEQQ
jgi:membrane protein YdbS with pleckstrin-like domain